MEKIFSYSVVRIKTNNLHFSLGCYPYNGFRWTMFLSDVRFDAVSGEYVLAFESNYWSQKSYDELKGKYICRLGQCQEKELNDMMAGRLIRPRGSAKSIVSVIL